MSEVLECEVIESEDAFVYAVADGHLEVAIDAPQATIITASLRGMVHDRAYDPSVRAFADRLFKTFLNATEELRNS